MTTYALAKWLHVLSAAILFGTGAGIAFFTWVGYVRCKRTRDLAGLRQILEITVIALYGLMIMKPGLTALLGA
ncbi:MAG: DUF2269 family protein [Burkholderiales bacterium]